MLNILKISLGHSAHLVSIFLPKNKTIEKYLVRLMNQ